MTAQSSQQHDRLGSMLDFTLLSPREVAEFLVAHQSELGADGITIEDVTTSLESGKAILETRPYGFALIQRKISNNAKFVPFLWVLYIAHDRRGKGLGGGFLRSIMRTHAQDFHLSRHCYGAQRRKFFGRLGFHIESKHGDLRCMTTAEAR